MRIDIEFTASRRESDRSLYQRNSEIGNRRAITYLIGHKQEIILHGILSFYILIILLRDKCIPSFIPMTSMAS